ncbi:MAG TPA: NAD-dependent epimerase/dehydratase family protein [Anaerolineae bacterium]|nr:NAD-dependent epimerase/dehydratase family protein [Anaerolineae bacterium]
MTSDGPKATISNVHLALVTGAAGFVGSAVVRALLAEGIAVRAFVRVTSDRRNLAGLDVELVEGDLRDAAAVHTAVRGCDLVFHVAALYATDPAVAVEMYAVNVGGTKHVLAAAEAAGVQRVVHTSTIGTIGRPADGTLPTENTPFNLWDSASHYVRSKYLGEVAALEAARRRGLPIVIVHPSAPVGPGDYKPTVTGRRIVDFLNGRHPSYLDGGINFCAVEDIAVGHLLAAFKGQSGQRYILGNARGNLSFEQFLNLLSRVSGRPIPPPPRPARRQLVDPRYWMARLRAASGMPSGSRPSALTCDPSRAIRELGLPQTPLADAFGRAVAWYREHGYVVAPK